MELLGKECNVKDVSTEIFLKICSKPYVCILIFMGIFLASWLLFFIFQSLCGIQALNLSVPSQSSHSWTHPHLNLSLSLPRLPPSSFPIPSIILPNLQV